MLKYAGVLQPLNISSHITTSNPKMIKPGDVREALIINYKGKKFLNIGTKKLIQYFGKMKSGTRIAIQVKTIRPELTVKEISREDIKDYWGYNVKERANLLSILSTWKGKIILTSKKGKKFSRSDAKKITNSNDPTLIVFGTTNKGIYDILGSDIKKIQNATVFNFFPNQGTQTVRLEEAILGTLSIINIINHNYGE